MPWGLLAANRLASSLLLLSLLGAVPSATAFARQATTSQEDPEAQEQASPIQPLEELSIEELERQRKALRDEQRAIDRRIVEARRAARARERELEAEASRPGTPEAVTPEAGAEETREAPPPRPRRPPRPASRSDQKYAFGSKIVIPKGDVASDLLALGGSVEVAGEVLGDAVAIGGPVEVSGRVTGDVIAVGGDVEVGPEAEILGDAVSVGGRVIQDEGASVLGKVSEVAVGGKLDFGDWSWMNRGLDWRAQGPWSWDAWIELTWSILGSLLLLVLTALVVLVARDPVDRVGRLVFAEPFKALLVGLAAELLFLPALVVIAILLVVSIIGIPLVVLLVLLSPFLVLLLAAASLFGFTAVAMATGRFLKRRFSLGFDGRLGFLIAGLIGIQGIALAGAFLNAIGLPFFIYALFGLFGFLVKFLAWTTGLGAVVLSGFSSRSVYVPPPPLVSDSGFAADAG